MNSAHVISDPIVSTKFIGQSSNSVQMSLTLVSLTNKVITSFPDSTLDIQSLSSHLLVVHDSNSQSFTLSGGPRHQQAFHDHNVNRDSFLS